MGLDLLPILPCAMQSTSGEAVVGWSKRPQQYCQNGRFVILTLCSLSNHYQFSGMCKHPVLQQYMH
jgi:hypothetical protein